MQVSYKEDMPIDQVRAELKDTIANIQHVKGHAIRLVLHFDPLCLWLIQHDVRHSEVPSPVYRHFRFRLDDLQACLRKLS